MSFKSEILREAMKTFKQLKAELLENPEVQAEYERLRPEFDYQGRSTPILVCPHCKRAVMSFIDIIDGKPFSIYRCKDHGDVVAIWSEVVNAY